MRNIFISLITMIFAICFTLTFDVSTVKGSDMMKEKGSMMKKDDHMMKEEGGMMKEKGDTMK